MDLARSLDVSASAVVNQLKNLKLAGLVRFESSGLRRAGRKVEYWLADRALARRLDDLERTLKAMPR
jgi:predicted transcriptional regulator